MKKKIMSMLLAGVLTVTMLSGCGSTATKTSDTKTSDDTITVYLWNPSLVTTLGNYIQEQYPDMNVELIGGNNNVFLYNYLAEHGELPDIITTRRFSEYDAKSLQPYLMDLSGYDVVSSFYPYALQYYTNPDGTIQWLPVCGIAETMIANKTIFDKYGIEIPENYTEFAEACATLQENNVKPYVSELSRDWAAHTLMQGPALDQYSSIDGIEWRSHAETAEDKIEFNDTMWKQIISEVNTFIQDTGLTGDDASMDLGPVRTAFVNGEAAIFRGTPEIWDFLQENMNDELVRLPYFSQTSDDSYVYTYASMNIALNKSLEEDEEKKKDAMDILNCMLSTKGQEIIAGGAGLLSYNVDVDSKLAGMDGVIDEINKNALYIRYASNNSFSASLQAVQGLLIGGMNESQALEAFKSAMNAETTAAEPVAEFEKGYSLSVNTKGGRDAASVILNTVRKDIGADLAFASYYLFASPIFEGAITEKELGLMLTNQGAEKLIQISLTGSEVKALVDAYLKSNGSELTVSNKTELPIASGMKMILTSADKGYTLKDIEVNGKSIQDDTAYSILLTSEMPAVLKAALSDYSGEEALEETLGGAWKRLVMEKTQIAEPEDYISIK